jgi:hypothetical protein
MDLNSKKQSLEVGIAARTTKLTTAAAERRSGVISEVFQDALRWNPDWGSPKCFAQGASTIDHG